MVFSLKKARGAEIRASQAFYHDLLSNIRSVPDPFRTQPK